MPYGRWRRQMTRGLPLGIRLTTQDVPAWYTLSLEGMDICVKIHKAVFDSVKHRFNQSFPAIASLEKEVGRLFIPPANPAWGFGRVFKWATCDMPGWVKLLAPLPAGKDGYPDHGALYAISASFSILFLVLETVAKPTGAYFFQMLYISGMRCNKGIYGGSISASVSPALCKWINAIPCERDEFEITEPRDTMVRVEKHLWNNGRDEGEFFFFNARSWVRKPKFIFLDCSGNACGLGRSLSDEYEQSLDVGYSLEPHNTDTPCQQMTLLAGLAKIYQMAIGEK